MLTFPYHPRDHAHPPSMLCRAKNRSFYFRARDINIYDQCWWFIITSVAGRWHLTMRNELLRRLLRLRRRIIKQPRYGADVSRSNDPCLDES